MSASPRPGQSAAPTAAVGPATPPRRRPGPPRPPVPTEPGAGGAGPGLGRPVEEGCLFRGLPWRPGGEEDASLPQDSSGQKRPPPHMEIKPRPSRGREGAPPRRAPRAPGPAEPGSGRGGPAPPRSGPSPEEGAGWALRCPGRWGGRRGAGGARRRRPDTPARRPGPDLTGPPPRPLPLPTCGCS